MNAIQLRLYAEECFNKHCAVCYRSAKNGANSCSSMRREKAKTITEIIESYLHSKETIKDWSSGYWSCFKEEEKKCQKC